MPNVNWLAYQVTIWLTGLANPPTPSYNPVILLPDPYVTPEKVWRQFCLEGWDVDRRDAENPPIAPASPRLLDLVRDVVRRRHYSYRTEETYLQWMKRFIYFSGKRHPA